MLTSIHAYSVEYFNRRVLEDIEAWPVGILADYARLVELLTEFGPDLGMPLSRAMGSGLFELRAKGTRGHRPRDVVLRDRAADCRAPRLREEDAVHLQT